MYKINKKMVKNIYAGEKKSLKLKTLKNGLYSTNGRSYYKDENNNKIYMSQKENPRFQDEKYIRKGNLVFYNANNKIGEPEYPLDKDKYNINIVKDKNKIPKQQAVAIFHNNNSKVVDFKGYDELQKLKSKYGRGKTINGQTVKRFIVYDDTQKNKLNKKNV